MTMKNKFRFSALLLMFLFVLTSFTKHDERENTQVRGEQGPPVVYDFYNFALPGYGGCSYYLVVTVNLTKGFGIRQVVRSQTLEPEDTWNLVINRDKNEIVVSETVQIVGLNINETFQMRQEQWYGNQSCHAPSGGSGILGTHWMPLSNNYFEFGEDMLMNGEFVYQSE